MTWLVQRVLRRQTEYDKLDSVDKHFEFDYMGSAEFEFGTLPHAWKDFVKIFNDAQVKQITAPTGETAFFVGRLEGVDQDLAQTFFDDQLHPARYRKHRLHEPTMLFETYNSDEPRFVGWWCVDNGYPWAIFRAERDALLWLECAKAAYVKKEYTER